MIVRMKKIALITQAKDAQDALKSLRSLGVVHVEHSQLPKNKDINLIQDDLSLINQALDVILKAEFSVGREGTLCRKDVTDWKAAARHIIDTWKRIDHLQEFSKQLNSEIKEWGPWGDFDPNEVRKLAQKNIYLRLFQVPAKEMKNFPLAARVSKIFTKGNVVYCAVFSREKFECAFRR